jgi:hypothetical protein
MRGDMSIPSNDERLVVSPRRARRMLDCGNTRLYELLKNKELESYVDGRSRKIIVASIHRYIAQRLKEAESTARPIAPAARRGHQAKVSGGHAAP